MSPPPSGSGRAVTVAARRERCRPGGAGLRLLARLAAERLDLGARERTDLSRPQPAHRIAPLRNAPQVLRDGGTAFRIGKRRDRSGGLVEKEPDLLFRLGDDPAIDPDDVALRIGLGSELADDGAVQLDAALLDELLRLAPRGDSGVGEDLLQPLAQDRGPFGCSPPVAACGASVASAAWACSPARSIACSS